MHTLILYIMYTYSNIPSRRALFEQQASGIQMESEARIRQLRNYRARCPRLSEGHLRALLWCRYVYVCMCVCVIIFMYVCVFYVCIRGKNSTTKKLSGPMSPTFGRLSTCTVVVQICSMHVCVCVCVCNFVYMRVILYIYIYMYI